MAQDKLPDGASPWSAGIQPTSDFVPAPSTATINQIAGVMATEAVGKRTGIYNILKDAELYLGKNGVLSGLAAAAGHIYSDFPMQQA